MEFWIILFIVILSICFLFLRTQSKIGGADSNKQIKENHNSTPIDFIKNATIEQIKEGLLYKLKRTVVCAKVLGNGYFGTVFRPVVPLEYDTPEGKVAVVIKDANYNQNIDNQRYFDMKILSGVLYIGGYADLTTEALIMMLINELPDKTHLPRLIDYGTCGSDKVTRLIMEMYGLSDEIVIDLSDKVFPESYFWNKQPKTSIVSNLVTLLDLFTFMHYIGDGTTAVLPNGYKCDIVEYYDSVCRDYYRTKIMLRKHNIYPFDTHTANVLLRWPKSGAPIPIFGDTGGWIAQPRKDIIIVSQIGNIEDHKKYIEAKMDPRYKTIDFIYWSYGLLTPEQFAKSRVRLILESPPYNKHPLRDFHLAESLVSHILDSKTAEELLEYYN